MFAGKVAEEENIVLPAEVNLSKENCSEWLSSKLISNGRADRDGWPYIYDEYSVKPCISVMILHAKMSLVPQHVWSSSFKSDFMTQRI